MRDKPKAVFPDRATVGPDVDLGTLDALVDLTCCDCTAPRELVERIGAAEIIVANKTRIGRDVIAQLPARKAGVEYGGRISPAAGAR